MFIYGKLRADNGSITVGDGLVICDFDHSQECLANTIDITAGPVDCTVLEGIRGSEDSDGIRATNTDFTIGSKGCIMVDLRVERAFEKLKGGYVKFGDNAILITGSTHHHSTSTPSLYAHIFDVGDNATLCITGEGWYANNHSLRDVYIGDNSVIRMQVLRDGQLIGPDIKAPNDSTIVI
jgi:hypothetical protein